MDPVSTAIIAGVIAGVAAGTTEVTRTALVDAYYGLKNLIKRKCGGDSDLISAMNALEAKPNSQARQNLVKEEVEATGADKDEELVATANQILADINAMPTGENIMQAIGSNIAQADRGSTASVSINSSKQ